MPKLIFTEGPRTGEHQTLTPPRAILGRAPDAAVFLDDPQVSAHHARLECSAGVWRVSDLDSSNGTLVNDRRVNTVVLRDGDDITIGDARFVFHLDGDEAPTAEQEAEERAPAEITTSDENVRLVGEMRDRTDRIRDEVAQVIVGQKEVVDQILMCLIAGGHGLLIGLPGMAKTLMVRTVARVLDLRFKRIQFTPDLMPTDITGTEVLETNKDTGEKEFRFIKGPVFCNILLADEINRTPPKTQAALLEAMQEKRVTVGNVTYELGEPFYVLATQNPIEQEGTYPLPEAQLDRFMFNIWVDYPQQDEEEEIVGSTTSGDLAEATTILSKPEVLRLQEVVRKVPVSRHVIKYVIRLVRATRPLYDESPEVTKKYVSTGAGPRAGQYLVLAAKARAVLEGRIHVSCADIRHAAGPVLRHRILTNFAADSEGMTPMDIIKQLLDEVAEPGEEAYDAAV